MANLIEQIITAVYKFFDEAYEEGWLLGIILVIIIGAVFIILR